MCQRINGGDPIWLKINRVKLLSADNDRVHSSSKSKISRSNLESADKQSSTLSSFGSQSQSDLQNHASSDLLAFDFNNFTISKSKVKSEKDMMNDMLSGDTLGKEKKNDYLDSLSWSNIPKSEFDFDSDISLASQVSKKNNITNTKEKKERWSDFMHDASTIKNVSLKSLANNFEIY